jgi:hypothetical protein
VTPDELDFALDYIDVCFWRPAKTGVPHEYTIREWRPNAEADFERFVALTRKYGVLENFYKSVKPYLHIGDLKYWTMGAPVNETTVLNRCSRGDYYGAQTAKETN